MASPASSRSALLIVDMQVGLFNGPEKPYEGERVLDNIQQLIRKARSASAPIFAVRHTGPAGSPIAAGSALWQLLPALELDPALDTLFDKTRPSSFFATGLAQQLNDVGIKHLVIVGMKTQFCIDTTCRVAVESGFDVTLVADAHTCMDTPQLSAKMIIEHHNATLGAALVKRLDTAQVRF
ncbi:cysteine hydrolase family protein [Pseudomonas purpurea]|uniref:cysteine hydrolase family protein n=1 Tax=Pseudomonas purpurea TaxID=3136737 RepID=UPI003264692E